MKLLIFSTIIISALTLTSSTIAATRSESIAAATTIGKWLTRATGQYDFLSATPVAVKRAGTKFFIIKRPPKQFASDYGYSYMQAPFSDKTLQAYQTLGHSTRNFPDALTLNRIHLNFGMENRYDLLLSYLYTADGIKGYGLGFKRQLIRLQIFSLAHRVQLAQTSVPNYFTSYTLTNDLSMALYFKLIDLYIGVKHTIGSIDFASDISVLKIPRIDFISKLDELEYFYGIVLALSFNTRLTLQINRWQQEKTFAIKMSLHFDSLLPTNTNWFKDPRYIRF